MATKTYYEFPARGGKPALKMTWYDGGLMPARPDEMGDTPLNGEGGALLIGSKGKLIYDTYGQNSRLLPKSLQDSVGTPPQKLPRITVSHEQNWADAAKGKNEPSCPFEYAARLTEVMLLGVVALRAGDEDPLRRREDADHEPDGSERVPATGLSQRLDACRN